MFPGLHRQPGHASRTRGSQSRARDGFGGGGDRSRVGHPLREPDFGITGSRGLFGPRCRHAAERAAIFAGRTLFGRGRRQPEVRRWSLGSRCAPSPSARGWPRSKFGSAAVRGRRCCHRDRRFSRRITSFWFVRAQLCGGLRLSWIHHRPSSRARLRAVLPESLLLISLLRCGWAGVEGNVINGCAAANCSHSLWRGSRWVPERFGPGSQVTLRQATGSGLLFHTLL